MSVNSKKAQGSSDNAEHEIKNPKSSLDIALVKWTKIVGIFTLVLAAAAIVSDVIIFRQLGEMKSAGTQTASMVTATNTLAEAAASAASATDKQADAAKTTVSIMGKEFVANQRAWIGPGGIATVLVDKETNLTPTIDKPITVKVLYGNTGKTPAEMTPKATIAAISIEQWRGEYFKNWIAIFKHGCLKETLSEEGVVEVYPNTASSYTLNINSNESWLNAGKFNMSNEIKAGKQIVVSQGCFIYKTLGVIHHSTFCFFYKAGDISFSNLGYCPIGQYAD